MMILALRMAALGGGAILKVTTYTEGFIGPTRKLLILDLALLIILLDQVCIFALPLLVTYKQENMYKLNKKEPLASTDDTLFDLLYREKNSLRHVAMVAKNLDDNKP